MRTYWTAHGLAALGHEVHVVTNAKEVSLSFRMHMRAADWQRCAASYGAGSVTVHWTDPVDRSQFYIPMASPFVSKLASIAATAHSAHRFDVIFSHYLEPYGVAGYLASQMTGLPHVVRLAGSDAGRLWRHPQLGALYDHVLRSAEIVISGHVVAARAVERGVDPGRIFAGGGYTLPPDLFGPHGPRLDLRGLNAELEAGSELRDHLWGDLAADRPCFGIYGKLSANKGTSALLSTLQRLKRDGANVGLVALAHGQPQAETRFRAQVQEMGLTDRVLQIPFLPHWRVPEFLRGCLAVCCLEQDFPIDFHSPITPLEVLLCGTCLVASTEVIRKLPLWERLPHGYGCVAIKDVNDVAELSGKLAAIVAEPGRTGLTGLRGRVFALEAQEQIHFPQRLEFILVCAARRERPGASILGTPQLRRDTERFPLTRIAAKALAGITQHALKNSPTGSANDKIDLEGARKILVELNRVVGEGRLEKISLAQAVHTEITMAAAEDEGCGTGDPSGTDPLFRLQANRWAIGELDFSTLVPIRYRGFRIVHFDYDVSEFRGAETIADLPAVAASNPSHVVIFSQDSTDEPGPNWLILDEVTARFLELVDSRATVSEILQQLKPSGSAFAINNWAPWVESLFRWGLIGLRQACEIT